MSVAPDRSNVITHDGHQRLQAELEQLTTARRAEIAAWLRVAREDGGDPAKMPT
jgi:transcription elongation GreA/GreB family factor